MVPGFEHGGGAVGETSQRPRQVLTRPYRDRLLGRGQAAGHRSREPQQDRPSQRATGGDVVHALRESVPERLKVAIVLLQGRAGLRQGIRELGLVGTHRAPVAATAVERRAVRVHVALAGGQQVQAKRLETLTTRREAEAKQLDQLRAGVKEFA